MSRVPLHAGRAELRCIADTLPRSWGLRRMPAQRADRRRGIGDSLEDIGTHVGDAADEFSLGDANVRCGWLCQQVEWRNREKQAKH